MRGLELSRKYFERFGLPMIRTLEGTFPELKGRFAAGLVGYGSECLGFDDELSADHDFGPAFCVWLPEEMYQKYGSACQKAYDSMPAEFEGFSARKVTKFGHNRIGVLCIEDFYYALIGRSDAPVTNQDWIRIPEDRLLLAVCGEVFFDEFGLFSKIRNELLAFYPEDVRLKKMAARAASMAQSGQYNYSRLCRRGEWTGASLAVSEFIKSTCSMVHLLNRRYTPFYKWMHRSLAGMDRLSEIYGLIDQLTNSFDNRSAWESTMPEDFIYGIINRKDQKAILIETICQLMIRELEAQQLTDVHDMYLESHAISMMQKIKDQKIAAMQLLEG